MLNELLINKSKMIQISTLLELRSKIKSKKPDFIRQDYQRRKRLGRKLKWRKPKGIHSKIRHHFKGRRKMPSPGYKSPREVRGLHASGLAMVMGFSVDDVKKIKNGSEVIFMIFRTIFTSVLIYQNLHPNSSLV